MSGVSSEAAAQRRVFQTAVEFSRNFQNDRILENPRFAGWIFWAAFHLNPPSKTMEILVPSGTYAAMQYILTLFSVHSLLGRAHINNRRYTYLTTFIFIIAENKTTTVQYDKSALHNNRYVDSKAYVMQVVYILQTGVSQTATIWLEGDRLEVFNPWENQSTAMRELLNTHVAPFLKQKWLTPKRAINITVDEYILRKDLGFSNYWNTYFLFVRSEHSRDEVTAAFQHASVDSLVEKRDLVVQTCGRLIAACAELQDTSADKREYQHIFGPNSLPFQLVKDNVEIRLPNIFTRCALTDDPLWNMFEDILPDAVAANTGGDDDVYQQWPADTDPKWKNFMETTKEKMKFLT